MGIIGRSREVKKLDEFFDSKKSEFMAVYGRRRVGKTYLINHYFEGKECVYFSATGIADASFDTQRKAFCAEISKQFFQEIPIEIPNDWFGVFEVLDKAIRHPAKKVVIFFDEFPWMVTPRSKLLQTLEYFWNRRWSDLGRVKLIICGSLSSWIIRNLIENTAGLYHRVTYRLLVEPFNLKQTETFLKINNNVSLTYNQIIKLYLVMGGIPLYLEQVKKGKSANQIIDEICFSKEGLLFDEMRELFKSLFNDSAVYMDITREIARHRYGLSKGELARNLKISRGGRFNERLKELEESGFIQSFLPYQHKEKGVYYRVVDEYTMFYFCWIEPDIRSIKQLPTSSGYWVIKSKEGRYQAWKGYSFESICYKHIIQILRKLELGPTSIPYAWRHNTQKNTSDLPGAQIDLLIDRDDDAVTICEIKYTEKPFAIDKKYFDNLKNKIDIFQKVTKSRKQIFLVMISAAGLKQNKYADELVSNTVTLDDLFSE